MSLTKERNAPFLLSICGASTFQLIRSLMPEADINSTSSNDLVAAVKRYYEPTPSKIAQRCIFRQSPGESIVAYAAALWEIAQHCDYGDTLSDMLRDRLVYTKEIACYERPHLRAGIRARYVNGGC